MAAFCCSPPPRVHRIPVLLANVPVFNQVEHAMSNCGKRMRVEIKGENGAGDQVFEAETDQQMIAKLKHCLTIP